MVASLLAAAVLLLAAPVAGHLCLMQPEQRDFMPIAALHTVGTARCGLTDGPCGSLGGAGTTQASGRIFGGVFYSSGPIDFQIVQNAVHANNTPGSSPGTFTGRLCIAADGAQNTACAAQAAFRQVLFTLDDPGNASTAPNVLTATGTLPALECTGCVIQVEYRPNDGSGPYYQCSDITIQSTTSTTQGNTAANTFGFTSNHVVHPSAAPRGPMGPAYAAALVALALLLAAAAL